MKNTNLPNSSEQTFLTDAGFETVMLFHKQFELPEFAAFPLLRTKAGQDAISEYFVPLLNLAKQHNAGFVLDTNTWRANPDWGNRLDYDLQELEKINIEAVDLAKKLRDEHASQQTVLINGVIGPRGDGYNPSSIMTPVEAKNYHKFQIAILAKSQVDLVTGLTITNSPEAIGIANAAAESNIPCVISFTLETDGRLPTGQQLSEAIAQVDAESSRKPDYFMINCAHPDHFENVLDTNEAWLHRIGGLRANASRMSHAELDCCEELDEGNPEELGMLYTNVKKKLPNLNVLGGCCGTDHRHIDQIVRSFNQEFPQTFNQ
jgi:S-methylmethionine-dependent homocysteine/selenocysteine methylase